MDTILKGHRDSRYIYIYIYLLRGYKTATPGQGRFGAAVEGAPRAPTLPGYKKSASASGRQAQKRSDPWFPPSSFPSPTSTSLQSGWFGAQRFGGLAYP